MIVENGQEYIWANLYQKNWLVKFEAWTGRVVKRLNLGVLEDIAVLTPSELYPLMNVYGKPEYSLNGIAYDPISKYFYITGKHWAYLFKI